jgi:FkbM family methyltransferase
MREQVEKGSTKVIKLNGVMFNVALDALPQRHADFWSKFVDGWEGQSMRAMKDFVDNDTVVIDVGAWIGPVTIYAAALGAKKVYAYEPDPKAYRFLESNCVINPESSGNIVLRAQALSEYDGKIQIGSLPGRDLGESTTTVTMGQNGIEVDSVSVSTMVKMCELHTAKKICIKIDIEGGEKDILPELIGALSYLGKPFLIIIEIHPYLFSAEESTKVERSLRELAMLADNFHFLQRRRIGELVRYPDDEAAFHAEVRHPNGLFDMIFSRS